MSRARTILPYIALALTEWGRAEGIADSLMTDALGLPTLAALQAEDCLLAADDYERLLTLLYAHAGPQLGLAFARTMNVSSYGVVGHAMLSAATAGEAIGLGLEYYRLTSSFMTLSSEQDGQALTVVGRLDYALPMIRRFAPEELLVGFTQVARQLLGEDFTPVAVHFSTPAPAYVDALQDFFRCPLHFDQPDCRFLLARELLALPLKTANALTASQLVRLCRLLLSRLPAAPGDDLAARVQAVVTARPGYWPSMQEVAGMLALSERTLRRRLQELGTDYQQLLDGIRRQLALQLMDEPVTIEQLAAVLGYSEAASFRRAFHRWAGMAPQLYRQQRQLGR